jgi:hypothetical protein
LPGPAAARRAGDYATIAWAPSDEHSIFVQEEPSDRRGDGEGIVFHPAKKTTPGKELTVDINGAKALKARLGPNSVDMAPPGSVDAADEEAPPVYRWLGITWPGHRTPLGVVDDDEPATAA